MRRVQIVIKCSDLGLGLAQALVSDWCFGREIGVQVQIYPLSLATLCLHGRPICLSVFCNTQMHWRGDVGDIESDNFDMVLDELGEQSLSPR